jgi:hypothetical protein
MDNILFGLFAKRGIFRLGLFKIALAIKFESLDVIELSKMTGFMVKDSDI